MVAARRQFLNAGYYQVFSDNISRTAFSLLRHNPHPVILDAGCGEGYYTSNLKNYFSSKGSFPSVFGFDISKFAVKAAAKTDREIMYAVASSFDIPVGDGRCDFFC